MNDLLNEFAVTATKAAECASWLAGQGIGPDIVYRPGASIVGVCRAHIEGDRWQPDPDGKPVLVSPVTYETRACCLDLIDLVCWQPGSPGKWSLRTGYGTALGENAIGYAWQTERPLVLNESPMEWLRANGEGAVILDWNACLSLYLGNTRRIIADGPALAQKINSRLDREQCWPMPEIRIRRLYNAA